MARLVQGFRCIARQQNWTIARMIVPQSVRQMHSANTGVLSAPALVKNVQVTYEPTTQFNNGRLFCSWYIRCINAFFLVFFSQSRKIGKQIVLLQLCDAKVAKALGGRNSTTSDECSQWFRQSRFRKGIRFT